MLRHVTNRQIVSSRRLFSHGSGTLQQEAPRPTVESTPSNEAQKRMANQAASASTSSFGSETASKTSSNTHFGFRDVLEDEKMGLVGGVFSSVASSYDVMNDAMSLGIHRVWKDQFVKQLNPRGGIRCLDVAGGTGDIANRILDYARTQHGDRNCHVTILDINARMLKAGQKRMKQTMYWNTPQLSFQLGNAEDLATSTPPAFGPNNQKVGVIKTKLPPNTPPLPPLLTVPIADNSIDLYTIAFGIRNCTHIDKVLSEAYRVLRPGGIFACLEFGKVNSPLLAQLYRQYSFNVIPSLGQVLAGDRNSYQYLVESIERFPSQPQFARMMQKAGFHLAGSLEASEWGLTDLGGKSAFDQDAEVNGSWQDLTLGIASIWHGIKL